MNRSNAGARPSRKPDEGEEDDREGAWVLVGEILRVLTVAHSVERIRLGMGPKQAIEAVRTKGLARKRRGIADRARLARAVHLVDRFFPTGANCYRRALLEAALDMGAAGEPLMMGFRTGDGACAGHAWLGSDGQAADYEVVVAA